MPFGSVSTDSITDSSGGVLAPSSSVFRNRIINGDMRIDQRNAGASVTPTTTAYNLDRWQTYVIAASKFSVQQNAASVTPPVGFTNYLGITSLTALSVASSDFYALLQSIEGYNIADLGWGTANAATITLSFWVRSSLTGTFGGSLRNNDGTRSYPFTYTISAANTWEKETITIAGDTSGTWLKTNGVGVNVNFGLGVGSTLSGTAGAWAAGNFISATGAVNPLATNSSTFYITGVQLEKGSTATSFDYRPYGTELQLCQRYLPAFIAESTLDSIGNAVVTAGTLAYLTLKFPVSARTRPTGLTASASTIVNVVTIASTALGFNNAGTEYGTITVTSAGMTVGTAATTYLNTAGSKLLFTGCEL